jgi:putative effector of murein hydrolase LrgA (UPF0299 family)
MKALAIVVALVIVGDAVAGASGLPVPGPALGLLALTLRFAWRRGPDAEIGALFEVAAPRFQLFFVPAAVGVVANFDILAASWVFLVIAVIGGTAVALVVTGRVVQALLGRSRIGKGADA